MARIKLIAIAGEAGSGKDTLARQLYKMLGADNAHMVVSYTTRPPREYETDGVDYHYITRQQMADLILENKILEAAEFNDWVYATGIDDLDENKINIQVLNPEGVSCMCEDGRIDLLVVRCLCGAKERLIRQLNREASPDVEEIIRRYGADKVDFDGFTGSDYSPWSVKIDTEHNTPDMAAGVLLGAVRNWTESINQ